MELFWAFIKLVVGLIVGTYLASYIFSTERYVGKKDYNKEKHSNKKEKKDDK